MLYLDSSALVKLVLPETETGALVKLLEGWPERISSSLARVEVLRAARRVGSGNDVLDRAESLLSRVGLVSVDNAVLGAAARLEPPELRSLDAIHLATALSVSGLGGLVSYDARLARAAETSGLPVFSPTAED